MQRVELPDTPVGRQLDWFLTACTEADTGDLGEQITERFTAEFLSRFSTDRVSQIITRAGPLLSGRQLARVDASSPVSAVVELLASGMTWRATCAVEAEPPHRITGLFFQQVLSPVADSTETAAAATAAPGGADAFAAALQLFNGRPADPYPLYERMRAGGPVISTPLGVAVVTGYDAVDWVLKSDAFGQDPEADAAATRPDWDDHPALTVTMRTMLTMNPPDHTRLRRLMAGVFTPRAVAELAPRVTELVRQLIDETAGAGAVDHMTSFAERLPVAVISELVGVPIEDRARLLTWSKALLVSAPLTDAKLATADAAAVGFTEYFTDLVANRRCRPTHDLPSALIAAGDEGDRLSESELVENLVLLYFAGFVTTVHLIGNGVAAFLAHPDQVQTLKQKPELARAAVEEVLRYDAPLQFTQRRVRSATSFGDVSFEPGQRVLAMLGAANRDPARFADAGHFDVTRSDVRPLSFGGGIHFCLGAALARLEGQTVFGQLFGADVSIGAAGDPTPLDLPQFRGFERLPVTVSRS